MLISTGTKVFHLDTQDAGAAPHKVYNGSEIRCVAEGLDTFVVAENSGSILVGGRAGAPESMGSVRDPAGCLLILGQDPLRLLVGTEGPHLLSVNGGTEAIQSFEALGCRDEWHTPWGGPAAVRSLAKTADGWVYADIHVGSIMRSRDRARSWEPVVPDLHEDVHQVATCPACDDLVFANTAQGVYTSRDRGDSWLHRARGLPVLYGRAIAVHGSDPGCLLASVSTGPGSNAEGMLCRTDNGGQTWAHVTDGFVQTTRGNIDTHHLAFCPEGVAWAVVGKRLFRSDNRGETWHVFWEADDHIRMVDCRA